jgi:quercetin dioxygenase-like cupin family protein
VRNLGLSLVLVLLFAGASNSGIGQEHSPIAMMRLYTGADGMSHFERVPVKFSSVPGSPGTAQSDEVSTAKAYIVRAAPGFFEDWHNADVRRYVVTISGRAEIEVAGDQKFVAQPGDLVLAEDLTGKGHRFRVLGDSDWVALFVDMAK